MTVFRVRHYPHRYSDGHRKISALVLAQLVRSRHYTEKSPAANAKKISWIPSPRRTHLITKYIFRKFDHADFFQTKIIVDFDGLPDPDTFSSRANSFAPIHLAGLASE